MTDADYPILTEATVAQYLRERPELTQRINPDTVAVREVGDGNLNLVFICHDDTGSSLALKQSLPYVRIVGPSWPLTADRSHAEATGLTEAFRASPSTTPQLYAYDRHAHVLAMEDLSALTVWRTALNDGHIAPHAGADCGRHIARLLFRTGICGKQPDEFRSAAAQSANPAMCRITEELVFTEPYVEHANNRFVDALSPTVAAIRSDHELRSQVARLKVEYMTRVEALIHGDFHTGSVMVDNSHSSTTKTIDTEFCFYGPIAFDLGTLLANLLFAAVRAACLGNDGQLEWLTALPTQTWSAFEDEFWTLWPQRVDCSMTNRYASRWLARIARDAIGFAGCEAVRRVVGFAKVSDIETLPPDLHLEGASLTLDIARKWLTDPSPVWTRNLFDAVVSARGRRLRSPPIEPHGNFSYVHRSDR